MKIAILSDLHDNYADWQIISKIIKKEKIANLIYCGDLASPIMLAKMAEDFDGHINLVYGNVADREREKIVAEENKSKVTHYGQAGEFILDGKKIALTHFPDQAKKFVSAGRFDLVCYGHTHLKTFEKIKNTYLLNPGTAGGMFQYPSFAVFDLKNMKNEFREITL
ncbi:MAG: metallophosphoesterase family protein [Patescibacteria group bacterium]